MILVECSVVGAGVGVGSLLSTSTLAVTVIITTYFQYKSPQRTGRSCPAPQGGDQQQLDTEIRGGGTRGLLCTLGM